MGEYSRSDNRKKYDRDKRRGQPRGQDHGRDGRRYQSSRSQHDNRASKYQHNSGSSRGQNDLPNVSQISKFASLVCPRCGEVIKDITGAIADKSTGEPVHFDCVLNHLEETEPHSENEKIVYIGHGNFAVIAFENPLDTRKFKIVRLIEWEDRNTRPEWRAGILDYYDLSKLNI